MRVVTFLTSRFDTDVRALLLTSSSLLSEFRDEGGAATSHEHFATSAKLRVAAVLT